MIKRTKSYLLLTMLVLTGFAGRIHTDTLSGKERRALVKELKNSRATLAETIEGLSEKQFDFVSHHRQLSVKDCIYHLASLEHSLWTKTKTLLQQPAGAANETNGNGLAYLAAMLSSSNYHPDKKTYFADINQALKQFRDDRLSIIRYAKTTTDDLHQYRINTKAGAYDVYELLLLNARYTEACARLIEEIKRSPNFPK